MNPEAWAYSVVPGALNPKLWGAGSCQRPGQSLGLGQETQVLAQALSQVRMSLSVYFPSWASMRLSVNDVTARIFTVLQDLACFPLSWV